MLDTVYYRHHVILESRREAADLEPVIIGTGIHEVPIVIEPDISPIP